MIRAILLSLSLAAIAHAQAGRGAQVFVQSCSSGYCHGARGGGAGAPRLAARGFDQDFIRDTVTNGIPGTSMPSFVKSLSRTDLAGVVAYVASLNGAGATTSKAGPAAKLTPQATRGQALFSDAPKSFGRCSTCHLVGALGIPVAAPVNDVPLNAGALKALKTPRVVTVTVAGESMPALVVAKKSNSVTFYDLTKPPPVLRTVTPAEFTATEQSTWQHSTVIGAYSDADLTAVLAYLRAAK
ncbi:MAG: cytochrome c [Bryobacteraceae bacterium]